MGVFIGLDVPLNKTAVCVAIATARCWQGKVPSEPRPLVTRLAEWPSVIDLAGIRCRNGCIVDFARRESP